MTCDDGSTKCGSAGLEGLLERRAVPALPVVAWVR